MSSHSSARLIAPCNRGRSEMSCTKPRTACARRTQPISATLTIWLAIRQSRHLWATISSTISAILMSARTMGRILALEREAVAWLMDLWQCDDHDAFWGSVVASGTEGNIWALYLAREAFPNAKLLYSREAHYSIPKAARILRMEAIAVDCETGGAIDIEAFD